MNAVRVKTMLRRLLLAFVLVSVGFALGRETAGERGGPVGDKVVVYYLHSTSRCLKCNLIESYGEDLIRTEFAAPLQDGRLEWQTVDYLRNTRLARRYQVGKPMVVVARFEAGRETEHRRLDRVMDLAHEPEQLRQYIRAAVQEMLEEPS